MAFAFVRKLASRLYGSSPSLDQVQQHVDTASSWLSWIAIGLAVLAALITFPLVMLFAVFPYITLTHTLWAGLVLSIVAGGVVYFFASKPADVADTASKAVWITRLAQGLAQGYMKRRQPKDGEKTK